MKCSSLTLTIVPATVLSPCLRVCSQSKTHFSQYQIRGKVHMRISQFDHHKQRQRICWKTLCRGSSPLEPSKLRLCPVRPIADPVNDSETVVFKKRCFLITIWNNPASGASTSQLGAFCFLPLGSSLPNIINHLSIKSWFDFNHLRFSVLTWPHGRVNSKIHTTCPSMMMVASWWWHHDDGIMMMASWLNCMCCSNTFWVGYY